ncbi:uncharacterized protein KY384_007687 [Bacidia gigantensis]|uniref:uncharacterized protein n=1 Tax=Bacidia gigantensis TaxID=2732470 RepID=UPI001D03B399|nr:uncharacterized protein KY384_007687 [Bacidia gigantensis]KAG8527535.1 hypothetical protein KY384_007687 [Bacidia gigantensis]
MVRIKHRYLVVHFLYPSLPKDYADPRPSVPNVLQYHRPTPSAVDSGQLIRLMKSSVEYMYGDYGLGLIASSLKIVYFSQATSTAIIRVARAHCRILWAALTWITTLGRPGKGQEEPCVMRVIRCSGTIRKAEEEVVRRAKEEIRRARIGNDQDEEGGEEAVGVVQVHVRADDGPRKRRRIAKDRGEDVDEDVALEDEDDGGVTDESEDLGVPIG